MSMPTRLTCVSDPYAWADRSGYERTTVLHPSFSPHVSFGYAPECADYPPLRAALELTRIQESRPAIRIRCTDVTLIVWNWGGVESSRRHYRYFLVSKEGDLLCEPPDSDAYWLKFFPLFHIDDDLTVTLTNVALNDSLTVEQPHVFAAGSLHFGHWTSDTLPLFLLEDIGKGANFFTTKLSDSAKSTLKFFCRGKYTPITELDMGTVNVRSFKFRELFVFANLGINRKNYVLRHALSRDWNRCSIKKFGKRIAYLVRGEVDGQYRLRNEDEIVRFCQSHGIEVVNLSSVPFYRSQKFFEDIDIFVMLNSSANTNFNVLGHDGSRLLTFLPDVFRNESKEVTLASAVYLVPRYSDINFGLARADTTDQVTHLASPSYIPVQEFAEAVDQITNELPR
jgi:hypothetical protein